MPRWVLRAMVCVLLVTSVACSGGEPGDEPNEGASNTATVTITSPKEGDTVESVDLKVKVKVTGIEIVNKIGEDSAEGEGHLVFYASNGFSDDYEIPQTQGQPANSGGTGYIGAAVAETTYDWGVWNIAAGKQKLAVQVVNNDNTPLATPAIAEVTVNVEQNKPPKTPKPQPGIPGLPGTTPGGEVPSGTGNAPQATPA